MTSTPSLLIICRHASWTAAAAACMETALTAGVYEQNPALVLLDEAVTWLLPAPTADTLHLKNLAQQLPALELYGVANIYVDPAGLATYGLEPKDSPIAVTFLQSGQLAALLGSAKATLVF